MKLNYLPALEAFNAIEARKGDGTPYLGVRGISVSGDGLRFRFWENDLAPVAQNGVVEIDRQPGAPRDKWLDTPQGRAFYDHLERAAFEKKAVFAVINKRGADDASGNWRSSLCAPVVDDAGRPIAGKILMVDRETGAVKIRFDSRGVGARVVDQFQVREAPVTRITGQSSSYSRDPAVRAAVLARSEGLCELCKTKGFLTPEGRYLETHHVVALCEGGADATSNVVALCACCHRKAHFSCDRESISVTLLQRLGHRRP